jgi:ABC-2 type transport system permease protein
MRLWWVELSRLFARRFTRLALVLVLVALGVMVFGAAYGSQKPVPGDRARAELAAAQQRAEEQARCREAQHLPAGDGRSAAPAPSSGAVPPTASPSAPASVPASVSPSAPVTAPPGEYDGVDCSSITHPVAEDLIGYRSFSFRDQMPGRAIGIGALLTVVGYLVAASFVGAEWQHGTMAGLLLWEPRRVRVFVAKLLALFTGLTLTGAVTYAVAYAAHWFVADLRGDSTGVTAGFWTSLGLTAVRGVALSLAVAACGFAIAYAARLSAAALGAAVAYLVGAEVGLRLWSQESQRWLLSENITAWMDRGTHITLFHCGSAGDDCTARVLTLSMWQGGAYLGGLALVLAVVAAVLFARRDVT